MRTRKHLLVQFVVLSLFVSVLILALAPAAYVQQDSGKVSTTNKPGLHVTTFDTLSGRVIVNLPDDMAAGDTISGTVMVEPKGRAEAEVQDDQAELSGTVIEWSVDDGETKTSRPAQVLGKLDISAFGVYPFSLEIPSGGDKLKPVNSKLKTKLTSKGGTPLFDDLSIWGTFQFSKPNLQLPVIGQQGRPVEIQGPFDGRLENTTLKMEDEEVLVLAESPRKLVFRSPTDVTGPVQLTLKEGSTEIKGTYRNIGVRLSAPKTNLLKGESTTVTVKLVGLQGIKDDVPLHLENAAPTVVTMAGGDLQTVRATPATVQPDGSFTTTRSISGKQAGAYSVTATVVIFNVCLQDDNNGNQFLFSSFTGDYVFCQMDPKPGSSNPLLRTDGVMDFRGGVLVAAADLDLQNGSIHPLFDFTGGGIHILQNGSTQAGSVTIQAAFGKPPFTITDRDTRNNTCTCK